MYKRQGEDRARLEGIVAVETAARAEAEAQLEEAASARDEALARLGSLERDAASFAVAKGAAETEAEEARAALERSEARRAKAEQDLVSASSESEQAARALSMLQDKVSALTDELYTCLLYTSRRRSMPPPSFSKLSIIALSHLVRLRFFYFHSPQEQ